MSCSIIPYLQPVRQDNCSADTKSGFGNSEDIMMRSGVDDISGMLGLAVCALGGVCSIYLRSCTRLWTYNLGFVGAV